MSKLEIAKLGHETPVMVFDVESVGLHGEGFAVGYVIIKDCQEVESGVFACDPSKASRDTGTAGDDRSWVAENVKSREESPDTFTVREKFWKRWIAAKEKGAVLAAECAWPVEGRFLNECIDTLPDDRRFSGPYPLIEISSIMLAAGMDPMANYPRLNDEQPAHNPLADARQSARLLMSAISQLKA